MIAEREVQVHAGADNGQQQDSQHGEECGYDLRVIRVVLIGHEADFSSVHPSARQVDN
jgi:hypothetical protein